MPIFANNPFKKRGEESGQCQQAAPFVTDSNPCCGALLNKEFPN
jgi:hypothetical protein